jgi:CRP-like cAMP-binding protein
VPTLKSEFYSAKNRLYNRKAHKHGIQILHQDELSLLEDRRKLDVWGHLRVTVIHPNDAWRRTFDMFTVLFVVYLLYKIPFDVAFGWYTDNGFETALSSVLDVWFLFDILLNFKTGYIKNGTAVMHQRKIINHYLMGWFLIDLLGTIPFKYVIGAESATSGKSIKLSKFFKIPKLMRISRVLKYLRDNRQVYDIFKIFIIVLLSVHIGACIWVLVLSPCQTDPAVARALPDTDVCSSDNVYGMYFESLHTCTSMILGITAPTNFVADMDMDVDANPDFEARSLMEVARVRVTTRISVSSVYGTEICFMLFGLFLMATLIAETNVYIMGKNQGSSAFQRKIDRVKHEMDYYTVPDALQSQVRAYYDYIWVNQKQYDDDVGLLSDKQMSSDLQRKLALHLFMDTVKHISFFAEVDDTVMGEICLSLKTLIFLPNDMILFKGDVGKELFIVAKGVVEVVRDDLPEDKRRNASPILLRSGSFFGEIALIMEVRRTCSVQAKTVCEINILLQRTFDDILREHPDFAKRMNELVVARQLETSLARADGGGSMKIRQADLNYANARVERTMMIGLRQRASGQGSMLRKGSINKKIFPNGTEENNLNDPAAIIDPEVMLHIARSAQGKDHNAAGAGADADDDSGGRGGGGGGERAVRKTLIQSATSGVKSMLSSALGPKTPAQLAAGQSNANLAAEAASVSLGAAAPGEVGGVASVPEHQAYYGSEPAINVVAPSMRENSMPNIFDDIERRKSIGEITEVNRQIVLKSELAKKAYEAGLLPPIDSGGSHSSGGSPSKGASSSEMEAATTSTRMGNFNGGALDLGKVHGSILMGGGGDENVDSVDRIAQIASLPGAGLGVTPSKSIKQIHQRMSRTEKMMEAIMKKLDIGIVETGGEGGGEGGGDGGGGGGGGELVVSESRASNGGDGSEAATPATLATRALFASQEAVLFQAGLPREEVARAGEIDISSNFLPEPDAEDGSDNYVTVPSPYRGVDAPSAKREW